MANSAQYSRGSSFDSLIANLRVINNHPHQASDLSVSVVGSSNKWWPDQQPSHHGMYACCLHRGPASPQLVQGGQHMPQAVGLRCRSASCPPTAAALRSEQATQLLLASQPRSSAALHRRESCVGLIATMAALLPVTPAAAALLDEDIATDVLARTGSPLAACPLHLCSSHCC